MDRPTDNRVYPTLTAAALRARETALKRFAAWEASHPEATDPERAIQEVAGLYELLPEAARDRPIDPSGVIEMHRRLSCLGRELR